MEMNMLCKEKNEMGAIDTKIKAKVESQIYKS